MEAYPVKAPRGHEAASAAREAVLSASAFSLKVAPWGGLAFHIYRPGVRALAFVSMDPEDGLFSVVEFRGPGFLEERTEAGVDRESLGRRITEIFFGRVSADHGDAHQEPIAPSLAAPLELACQ